VGGGDGDGAAAGAASAEGGEGGGDGRNKGGGGGGRNKGGGGGGRNKAGGKKGRNRGEAGAGQEAGQEATPAPTVAAAIAPLEAGSPLWWEELEHQVAVVYSSEQQKVGLLAMPEGVASASELGSQPNFRVRIMPVLPPLPAAAGAALASHGLSMLAERPVLPLARPVPSLSPTYLNRLYNRFVKHELTERRVPPSEVLLAYHEVGLVVCDLFRCRCALTGRRLHDPKRPTFCLVRYDASKPADCANVLFVVAEAAEAHERDGIEALPVQLRRTVDRAIADGLCGRRVRLMDDAERLRGGTRG
jgi:hypothetical protein